MTPARLLLLLPVLGAVAMAGRSHGLRERLDALPSLTLACAASEVIVTGSLASAPDGLGRSNIRVTSILKRTHDVPALLPVRVDAASALPDGELLLFLVSDPTAGSGTHAPVDPDSGIIALDGGPAPRARVLEAVALALDPPEPSGARAHAWLRLVRSNEWLAHQALDALARRDFEGASETELVGVVRDALDTRRVSPQTAELLVLLLGDLSPAGTDLTLVELVAREAPPGLVDAACDAMSATSVATPQTGEHILHALGAATSAAEPGLLVLAGCAGARDLLPRVLERLESERPALVAAALRAAGDLGDESTVPRVAPFLRHGDRDVACAAARALERLEGGAAVLSHAGASVAQACRGLGP